MNQNYYTNLWNKALKGHWSNLAFFFIYLMFFLSESYDASQT